MKYKIKNWLKEHEFICGVGLLCASLATAAFGGAYLGANMAVSSIENNLYLVGPDGAIEL